MPCMDCHVTVAAPRASSTRLGVAGPHTSVPGEAAARTAGRCAVALARPFRLVGARHLGIVDRRLIVPVIGVPDGPRPRDQPVTAASMASCGRSPPCPLTDNFCGLLHAPVLVRTLADRSARSPRTRRSTPPSPRLWRQSHLWRCRRPPKRRNSRRGCPRRRCRGPRGRLEHRRVDMTSHRGNQSVQAITPAPDPASASTGSSGPWLTPDTTAGADHEPDPARRVAVTIENSG